MVSVVCGYVGTYVTANLLIAANSDVSNVYIQSDKYLETLYSALPISESRLQNARSH